MSGNWFEKLADPKTLDFYESVRHELKWRNLNIAEKLELLMSLDKIHTALREMDEEELALFTNDFAWNQIPTRGQNRLHRIRKYKEEVTDRLLKMNKDKRTSVYMEISGKKKINL